MGAPPEPVIISPTLEENRSLSLKPVYISLGLDESAFPPELGGKPAGLDPGDQANERVFDTAIRGAGQYADRIWIFQGDSYYRYFEKLDGKDEIEGPFPIAGNWKNWPPNFATGIDGALMGTGTAEGKIWFFKRGEYLRYDLPTDRVVQNPRPIAGNWPGVPNPFAQGIDAVIHGLGAYFGISWFFKGDKYLRYNMLTDKAEGDAKRIDEVWGGWPESFRDGIDFAFYGTGTRAEKIYFFKGTEYLLYDLESDRVKEGPASILDNWRALARFMPRPQLFLMERYELRTFHGQTGRGPQVGNSIQVVGKGKTEFYVITKRSETVVKASTSNVLESQSQQTAESFSNAVNTDQSQSGSEEKYDYSLDASFHGEASMTVGGGEADADVHVKGGSQDVRSGFANSVKNNLQRNASETREIHKDQSRTDSSSSTVNQQTEQGFKQIIDNSDNPEPLNYGVFQMTQEYIVVLTLVDALVAFRNGNSRQSQTAAIGEMAALLKKCLVSTDARERVAATVIDVFKNVVDYKGETRSLLKAAPNADAGRYEVDPTVSSTHELLDTTGALQRRIVVPGIILKVDSPVVLTPNTFMGRMEMRSGPG